MLIALLAVSLVHCAFASGEDARPLRISAAICGNKDCTDRRAIGFELTRIDVQVVVPLEASNRRLTYGLVCDSGYQGQSTAELDGERDAPLFLVSHREVPAGTCAAVAMLERADGSRVMARSPNLIVLARR